MDHLDAWESGIWKKELEKQLEESRVRMANAGKLEKLIIILDREGETIYPDFRWCRTDNSTIILTDKQRFYSSMEEARENAFKEHFDYEVTEKDTLKSLLCSKLGISPHKDQPIYVEDGDISRGTVLKIHCQDFGAIDDVIKKAETVLGKALRDKGVKLEKIPFSEAYLAMSRDKTR